MLFERLYLRLFFKNLKKNLFLINYSCKCDTICKLPTKGCPQSMLRHSILWIIRLITDIGKTQNLYVIIHTWNPGVHPIGCCHPLVSSGYEAPCWWREWWPSTQNAWWRSSQQLLNRKQNQQKQVGLNSSATNLLMHRSTIGLL